MPISNWDQIPAIMHEVYRLQPHFVFDLGIGFGKYGPLLREVLDGMHGRCDNEKWKAYLVGAEVHEAYMNPCWSCYSYVETGNFITQTHRWKGADLVLMIDSLEHLAPEVGPKFLDAMVKNNKHVIVSVPVEYMPQGAVFGNEFETHRTHYKGDEFERFNPTVIFSGATRVFSIKGAG